MLKSVKRIAITGGAGQIAYQLLFRIASGELLGFDQPIILNLLEIPEMIPSLEGVKMELNDCAFPLLYGIEVTSDPYQAFKEIDLALLVGAKPRTLGMERGELLEQNAKIFIEQGKALNEEANLNAKIFVVGNPCNTNCWIAMNYAPRLNRKNFYAMTRLDQNRASFFLAERAGIRVGDISRLAIWGNHSSTQIPDFTHALIKGEPVEKVIQDRQWLEKDFIALVRNRGSAVIKIRGKSSAASAAQALIEAVKDVLHPTPLNQWFSSGVWTEGNCYGIHEDLIFSFPCVTLENGQVAIVRDLNRNEFLQEKIKVTERELLEERDLVKSLITV